MPVMPAMPGFVKKTICFLGLLPPLLVDTNDVLVNVLKIATIVRDILKVIKDISVIVREIRNTWAAQWGLPVSPKPPFTTILI